MIDAVSIKEDEGITEPGKSPKAAVAGNQDFALMKEELHITCEATKAAMDTLMELGSQAWGGIKRTVGHARHQPLSLALIGIGAGLMVGWILYRRR